MTAPDGGGGKCEWCGEPIPRGAYCSTRHRVAAFRERRRYASGGVTPGRVTQGRNGAGVTAAGVTSPGGGVTGPEDAGVRNAVLDPVTVAALYVRADGHYATMPGVDAWPEERDASRYTGPGPVVAHPPCAPWGQYRTIAPTRQRADLAVRAVDQVRWYGGVLEHPADSRLWPARDIPKPGEAPDQWGGWSMLIRQSWWGHRAPKPTWLYVVGCRPADIPELPPPVPDPGGRIENMAHREREMTPPDLAAWLVELARRCSVTRARGSRL